ncbi:MAG TPA: LysM peptidoglycan-binding domain-containing protein [Marmoricola sp.]|nr:LysM peptidoglycan-binding domain-containing protein [Marmoricola sp.]
MSTITISSGSFAPTVRAPRVRLTRRGRAVFFVVFLAVALAAMTALGSWAAASREAGTPEPVRVVEVQPGDTLYAYASQVAAPGHVQDMVAHIEQLNSLDGPELQVGQRLAIPRS